jgi:hypothetical protein
MHALLLLCCCRLAILYQDWHGVKKLLARAKTICEAGGDWEHKNKLKVQLLEQRAARDCSTCLTCRHLSSIFACLPAAGEH